MAHTTPLALLRSPPESRRLAALSSLRLHGMSSRAVPRSTVLRGVLAGLPRLCRVLAVLLVFE
jgi:hypothetical protein